MPKRKFQNPEEIILSLCCIPVRVYGCYSLERYLFPVPSDVCNMCFFGICLLDERVRKIHTHARIHASPLNSFFHSVSFPVLNLSR